MNKRQIVTLGMVLFFSTLSQASGILNAKVKRTVASVSTGAFIVEFDGVVTTTGFGALPDCARTQTGTNKKYLIDGRLLGAKMALAEILSAQTLGKAITVQGSGTCKSDLYPDIELLEFTNAE